MALGKDIKFIKNGIIELLSGGGKKAEIKSVWVVVPRTPSAQEQIFKCSEGHGFPFYFDAENINCYSVAFCSDNEEPKIDSSNILMSVGGKGFTPSIDFHNDFSIQNYALELENGVKLYRVYGDSLVTIVNIQDTRDE